MEDHKTKIVVLESGCPHYQAGDEIYFSGAFIEKEKSAELCAVYAARRGGSVKPTPVQCPDCGESVVFQVMRLD